jgi:hypothetical protein
VLCQLVITTLSRFAVQQREPLGVCRIAISLHSLRGKVHFNACAHEHSFVDSIREAKHYATSRKFLSLRPDEMDDFFQFTLIPLAAIGPGVYSASHRKNNVYGNKAAPGA